MWKFHFSTQDPVKTILSIAAYALSAALYLSLNNPNSHISPAIYDVLFGLLVGFPIVTLLTKVKLGKVDFMLGNISYGVFLNQFFLIWSFRILGFETQGLRHVSALIVLSVAMAAITFWLVERPVIAYRRSIRYQPQLEAAQQI